MGAKKTTSACGNGEAIVDKGGHSPLDSLFCGFELLVHYSFDERRSRHDPVEAHGGSELEPGHCVST